MKPIDHKEIGILVDEVREGNYEAFGTLYSCTYQSIYFLTVSIIKDENLAQDVLQDTYIRALDSIGDLKNSRAFVAWINRIAYHMSLRALEQNAYILDASQMPEMVADERDNPLADTLSRERKQALFQALSRLNKVLRATVIMKYYEEFKEAEIAKIMDCPIGTVKSRLNTARRELKKTLEKDT